MKVWLKQNKRLILRVVIFAIFVFWVVGFPRLLPYTYPGDQYYITYIQDSWSMFFMLVLYPMACLLSGALCALIRIQPVMLWMIPDMLVCLPEFYDRAEGSGGFRFGTFALNILVHLALWVTGVLLMYGLRWLSVRIRHLIKSYRDEYQTYKQRNNGGL